MSGTEEQASQQTSGMRKPLRELRRRPLFAPLMLPLIGLAVLVVAGWAVVQAQATTTVILVRHAEKVADAEDPGLTALGAERAAALVEVLASAELDGVFASQFRRTQDTVAPLAQARGLEVRVVDARDPARLTDIILSEYYGGTVVVAGHSNTVPDLIRMLGVETDLALTEADYDGLFIVSAPWFGEVTMTRLRYGPEQIEEP